VNLDRSVPDHLAVDPFAAVQNERASSPVQHHRHGAPTATHPPDRRRRWWLGEQGNCAMAPPIPAQHPRTAIATVFLTTRSEIVGPECADARRVAEDVLPLLSGDLRPRNGRGAQAIKPNQDPASPTISPLTPSHHSGRSLYVAEVMVLFDHVIESAKRSVCESPTAHLPDDGRNAEGRPRNCVYLDDPASI